MPSLVEYAKAAIGSMQRLRAMRSGDEVAMVTARPADLTGGTRYRQIEKLQLVMRNRKWVAVAVARNAAAVAMCSPRVVRVTPSKGGMLRGISLTNYETKRLRANAGRVARKALGTYKEGWEEITDDRHPLVKLLGQANEQVNGFELFEKTQMFLELTGDAYWAKVYGREKYPIEVHNLFPQWMEIRPEKTGAIRDYNYGRTDTKIALDPKSVVHFLFPNPYDPYYGLAPLARCVQEADLSEELTVFARSFLDNGAVGGTNVFIEAATTKDQLEQVKNEFDAKYGGARHANSTRILKGKGVRVEYPPQLDKNPILTQSEIDARNIIAACFDIPVGLLNMEEKSLANGEVVAPHWQLMSIKPRVQRLEDKINEDLVPDFREALNDPTLLVVFPNAVDEDREKIVVQVSTLAGGKPLITQDEARAELGMPPLTAAQKAELEPPEPEPMGGGKGKDSQSKALWHGDGHAHVVDIETKDDKLPSITRSMRVMAEALTRIFRSFASTYADSRVGPGLAFDIAITRAMVFEVFGAIEVPLNAILLGGYNRGVDEVNTKADLDMARREAFAANAVESLDQYRLKLSNGVTQTYEGRVRSVIQAGLREGAHPHAIAQAVRTTIPNEAPAAADRIARTETSRALNAGKDMAYKDSGIVTTREWLLSGNPCKICREVHEKYRYAKVGEPFVQKGTVVAGKVMDYADIMGGDAHPNCSCGVSAVLNLPHG